MHRKKFFTVSDPRGASPGVLVVAEPGPSRAHWGRTAVRLGHRAPGLCGLVPLTNLEADADNRKFPAGSVLWPFIDDFILRSPAQLSSQETAAACQNFQAERETVVSREKPAGQTVTAFQPKTRTALGPRRKPSRVDSFWQFVGRSSYAALSWFAGGSRPTDGAGSVVSDAPWQLPSHVFERHRCSGCVGPAPPSSRCPSQG